MTDLLLECFSEEIPARMQQAAAEQLGKKLEDALSAARLTFDNIKTFVSPRHLTVSVAGLPERQPDQVIERKGPKCTAPDAAIEGFVRSTGLSREELQKQMIGKDECYVAVIHEKGKPTSETLRTAIEHILQEFHWPKSQGWGSHAIRWVRPLQRIICLFGNDILPIKFGHLEAVRETLGHRFLSPQPIALKSADRKAYQQQLEAAHVLVDFAARRTIIKQQIHALCAQHQLTLVEDESLLDEVTGLVEWPVALMGGFDRSFLTLPPEILISEMRHHQKYFALQDSAGSIAPHFITIANIPAADNGTAILQGNSRVLRARLSDGMFFWNQDRKRPLSEWQERLSGMIFHAKLGSMQDKTQRIEALAPTLAQYIPGADKTKVSRAAALCKADLVTGMVGEFPDLQGIMGRYYALAQKEDHDVAEAIHAHYQPLGAHDDTPRAPVAVAIAIADKLDSLMGLFAIGDKPTGSKDPYALRRAALGIIRIILDNNVRMPLRSIFEKSAAQYDKALFVSSREDTVNDLFHFFMERLKVMLRDQGIRHDIINAALYDTAQDDLMLLVERIQALQQFLTTPDGTNLLSAYRRANNIVTAEAKKDGAHFTAQIIPSLFAQPEETHLYTQLETIKPLVENALTNEQYADALMHLASLRAPLDAYFDAVMVNSDNLEVRQNRLCTLNQICLRMDNIVKFSAIEG